MIGKGWRKTGGRSWKKLTEKPEADIEAHARNMALPTAKRLSSVRNTELQEVYTGHCVAWDQRLEQEDNIMSNKIETLHTAVQKLGSGGRIEREIYKERGKCGCGVWGLWSRQCCCCSNWISTQPD